MQFRLSSSSCWGLPTSVQILAKWRLTRKLQLWQWIETFVTILWTVASPLLCSISVNLPHTRVSIHAVQYLTTITVMWYWGGKGIGGNIHHLSIFLTSQQVPYLYFDFCQLTVISEKFVHILLLSLIIPKLNGCQ